MDLSDRMQNYEAAFTGARILPRLPTICRVDGRAFHTFCRGLDKPFDRGFHNAMVRTADALVDTLNATIAHTASDEITVLLYDDGEQAQPPFGGKLFKLNSVVASVATGKFIRTYPYPIRGNLPSFDCRTFQLPSRTEAVNHLVWREQAAVRNSVAGLAQAHFSHRQLHKKNGSDMQDMLMGLDPPVNWNDLPPEQKRGAYVRRIVEDRPLTEAEWSGIPEKHRPPRDQLVTRSRIDPVAMPRLTQITNRVDVIFDGAEPDVVGALLAAAGAE